MPEKKVYIKLFGCELQGYTLKKLVFHLVVGVATALGAIHQGILHNRQSELERREVDCERRLDRVLQLLEERPSPPSMLTFGSNLETIHSAVPLLIPLPQPQDSLRDIIEGLRARQRESKTADAPSQ